MSSTVKSLSSSRKSASESKGSVLDFAILGLLSDANLHGYEIRKRLGQILGPIGRLSFGTLYPSLGKLEKIGFIKVVGVTQSRTGLTTARGRKVYSITEKGTDGFAEMLSSTGTSDERDFTMRLTFAGHLTKDARNRLLLRRKDHLSDRLEEANESLSENIDSVDQYGKSVMEHRIFRLKADIDWLDKLISSELQDSTGPTTNNGGNNEQEN